MPADERDALDDPPVNARDVWILYLHEIRGALRERSIVLYSLLIPAVLYPALLWIAWTGAMFVAGQTSGQEARVALVDVPAAHAELKADLAAEKAMKIVEPPPPPDRAAKVRSGDVDAILEWAALTYGGPPRQARLPPEPPFSINETKNAEEAPSFTVTIIFDGSKSRSEQAADKLERALRTYRDKWLTREATRRGVDPSTWSVARFESRNAASGRDMGAFLLKLVIPMVLLVMISMGCFYPAIDATAGERERATWETLMTVAASRSSVVLAKYLYVATFGAVAGLLNLGAMIISLRAIVASAIGERAERASFLVPLSAIPLTAVCAVFMALFIAAVMMILASFARTFKEGQAMITPFYLMIVVPTLLLQSPDTALSPGLALIPLVNVALTFREALTGSVRWPLVALAAATQLAAIAACVFIAARLTTFEDAIAGPAEGGLKKLVITRIRRLLSGAKGGPR